MDTIERQEIKDLYSKVIDELQKNKDEVNNMWAFYGHKKLRHGDVIRIPRMGGLYHHFGIYVDDTDDGPHVIHYWDGKYGNFKGVVQETSLYEFLDGGSLSSVEVVKFNPKKYRKIYSREETVHRARNLLGRNQYNLIFENCETFTNMCKTGKHESSQVNNALWSIGLVIAVCAFGGIPGLAKSSVLA